MNLFDVTDHGAADSITGSRGIPNVSFSDREAAAIFARAAGSVARDNYIDAVAPAIPSRRKRRIHE